MADLKISEMTPAAELTGAELIECVQGGVNVKQELTGLKTWVNDGVQPFSSTLDALSSFNTNGIMVQTDTSEFIGRTIEGTTSQIVVSNGNGVAGNPTISLPASGVTAGTYGSGSAIPVVTVNSKGIVTGVSTASLTVSPVFSDSEFRIYDNGDANKILAFEVSNIVVSPAATPTTKTITVPNANVDLGDLPSVATNDGNVLGGTRCRILGGSNNNVSGTDNVAIGCTSCTLTGNSQVITSGGYVTDITQAGGHIQSTLGVLKQGQMIRVTVCLSGDTFWGTHTNTACTNGGLYSATTVPKTFLNSYGAIDGYATTKTVAVHKLRIIGRNRSSGGTSLGNANLFIGERTVIYDSSVGLTITTVGTDYVSGSPVTLNITNDGGKLKIAPFFNHEVSSMVSSVWEVFVDSIYTNY